MGWKYEVHGWMLISIIVKDGVGKDNYNYMPFYQGQSLLHAIWAIRTAKKAGAGCVKLEIRS